MVNKHLHNINYRIPIIALIFLLTGFGLYSFFHIKSTLYPEVVFPKIKIIVHTGPDPVYKMMATVTVPIENAIKKTEGLDYVSSTTSRGAAELSVYLKWNTNVDNAKQQIESFVNQIAASMPSYPEVRIEKMNPSILPVLTYSLEGKKSQVELRNIAEFQIKPFLLEVDGVSNVDIIGGKTKEYQIIVNPARLSKLNISLAQIQSAINQENIFQSNGYIQDHNRLYLTLTNNELENTEELKNLVIENSATRLVLLRDVADLQINETKDYVRVSTNGVARPIISITKQPTANLIEVSDGLEKRVSEMNNLLPKGVHMVPMYKQATLAKDSINGLQTVLWLGLVFSLILVFLFLRSISATAVVFISIPFSLTLSLLVLYILGYTFNVMTLGGIAAATALMIDDIVIVVEQMFRTREEFPEKKLSFVVGKSIRFLLPTMIATSLSTIIIFIPYLVMSGAAGAYFKVLASTLIIALTSSFIVSWWITPMLFLYFPNLGVRVKPPAPIKTNWIKQILSKPIIGLSIIGLCMVCYLFIPGKLKTSFLPEMDEGTLIMNFQTPPGTSLDESDRILRKVDAILKTQPEVVHYARSLGTQMGVTITEPNKGDILIQLDNHKNVSTDDVADQLRKKIESGIPAIRVDFGQMINTTLNDLISNSQPIEIKLFGDDQATIENLSTEITELVRKTNGTTDAFDGIVRTGPEVILRPNVALLAQLGMNPSDFQFQLQTQIEGSVISTIIDKDQLLNVRIIYPNANSTKIHSLENTNILLPNGALKPLLSVASIDRGTGETQVHRENQKIMGIITAGIRNRDLGSTLNEIKSKINQNIQLPTGYHIEYAGTYLQQNQSFKELLLIFLSGLVFVFVIILFLFRKLRVAILILFLTGISLAGSLLALYITNTPLNVGSYTGLIIVAGIIGENAVFTYLHYLESSKTMPFIESISYSIASRLRPKLMTVLAAILAFLPLASGIGRAASVHQPLAIAVIGGLIFALPLLLIVLPTLEGFFVNRSLNTETK